MNDDKPQALLLAKGVADYLDEELRKGADTFIPVHRDIAEIAMSIALAAVDSLQNEVTSLQ